MNEFETKIRNVIKAWRNCLYDHFRNDELLCSMDDALLDLESLLDQPALNTEPPGDDRLVLVKIKMKVVKRNPKISRWAEGFYCTETHYLEGWAVGSDLLRTSDIEGWVDLPILEGRE